MSNNNNIKGFIDNHNLDWEFFSMTVHESKSLNLSGVNFSNAKGQAKRGIYTPKTGLFNYQFNLAFQHLKIVNSSYLN